MGLGRFVCVALPLILTGISLAFLLYATLAGISHENLELFRLDTKNLSISPLDAGNIADKVIGLDDIRSRSLLHDLLLSARADSSSSSSSSTKTANITASDLGLADSYDVTLWGFCAFTGGNDNGNANANANANPTRSCSTHQFDWAAKTLPAANITTANGVHVQLPHPVRDALSAFKTLGKAADIAFVLANIALAAQIVIGFFATFSRAASCLTWLVSLASTLLVGLSAGLATAIALVVLAVVDSTAKFYGVKAHLDSKMLAVVWIATAFSMAASIFWISTVCCCRPDHHRRSSPGSNRSLASREPGSDAEKLLPAGFPGAGAAHKYAPLDEHQATTMSTAYVPASNRSDLAYEPFSHRV